ncbi:MAG TPA: hypothetical protein O0X97_01210 [Methanocorpusculum sp.]|nr:hypothetical protein [Methanocorpusculum sp.]
MKEAAIAAITQIINGTFRQTGTIANYSTVTLQEKENRTAEKNPADSVC